MNSGELQLDKTGSGIKQEEKQALHFVLQTHTLC
jgi:hypothetical protein